MGGWALRLTDERCDRRAGIYNRRTRRYTRRNSAAVGGRRLRATDASPHLTDEHLQAADASLHATDAALRAAGGF